MFNPLQKFFSYLFLVLLATMSVSACGSKSSSTLPTTVPTTATVFYAHNLVFKNSSTLLSTGYNGFGQLGTGNLLSRSIPGGLKNYYPFRGYAAGGNHSVAFTNNSSAVYSWGYNAFGQLGNNSTTYSDVPVRSGTITGVTALAAGANHTLALKNDGTVWGWGSNDSGQIGTAPGDTKGHSATPRQIVGSAGFGNISSISANGKHSLAIAKGGALWAWGLNSLGQIGLDPATTTISADTVNLSGIYTQIAEVTSIAAGSGFSYAVAKDGTLWAWGINDNGQLGDGTTVKKHVPVKVLKGADDPLLNVVQAAGGIQHGLALLADGTVWAWGYNHFNQLGATSPDSSYAVQVTFPVGGAATDIRAFGSSSMAKIDGYWYVWGDNTYGQLGKAGNATVTAPTKMF